jgi:hypothetical protein
MFNLFLSCGVPFIVYQTPVKSKNNNGKRTKYDIIKENNFTISIREYQFGGPTLGFSIYVCYNNIYKTNLYNVEKTNNFYCRGIKDSVSILKLKSITAWLVKYDKNGIFSERIKLNEVKPQFGSLYFTCPDFMKTMNETNQMRLEISFEKDSLGIISVIQKDYFLEKRIIREHYGLGHM